jgi:hypothetical protein
MRNLKIHSMNLQSFTSHLLVLVVLIISGCVQSPTNKKTSAAKTANTDTSSTTKLPSFTTGNNFIQNGANIYQTTVNIDLGFADMLQLRGKDVDSYIRSTGTSTVACLVSRFTTSNSVVLIAAIPRSVYNFTSQSLEYYYGISPADSSSNQSFCQKTGLINQLYSFYPLLVPKFKLADLCTTCGSSYTSQSLELYNTNGIALSQIATKQLAFSLTNNSTSTTPIGQTCTSSSQCVSQGYDCCSSGQCVSDLSLRPGVDPSAPTPEYAQALQDILNNPSNIYLYPQFYFLCSQSTGTPTTPTPSNPTTPENEAAKRINDLTDLYNCTNKVEGEAGVCTITHKDFVVMNYGDARDFKPSGVDDKSFADTFTHLTVNPLSLVSIEKILYGGVVIYDYSLKDESQLISSVYEDSSVRIEGNQNDDITSPTMVKVKVKPSAATSNDLQIKYKIDASCEKVNATLAKCEKYYIQDQGSPTNELGVSTDIVRRRRVTNHYPTSNVFKLPYYASTTRAITVEVDGLLQKQDDQWQLTTGVQNAIQFLPVNTLKVAKDQKVRITYFVDLTANPNLMKSKLEAREKINTICSCSNMTCNIAPIKNANEQVIDYACVYPEPPAVEPPLSQKIYLSSKAVPVRMYDQLGTSQKSASSTTIQEGLPFLYRGDNLLNPNNRPDITNAADTSDTYVGFNEIYGSLNTKTNSAKPAQEVSVKKDKTYDIYVDRGSYSNCAQCGNDYYSQLTKLFPLTQFGGGSIPLIGQTNRSMTSGIRSDEMKFGRACLVPASMLPWSHTTYSKEQDQRLNRLSAQHFFYSNGYQYDWYGFDYGSVIGSFDGVKWFSIGSKRRIKAETNKLFIAVNGVFGDLAVESTFEVSINDAILNPSPTDLVTTDYDSDGAQCQQYHQCSTDNDCAATLGWEYACAPIGEITTSWPQFDENAKEMAEVSSDKTYLTSILGISNTGKRCVYRGRGALCTPNYAAVNVNSTFNKTTTFSFHSCADNNYCQTFTENGDSAARFNNRIVRFGRVPTDTSALDTFGLGALVAGRPFAYNGVETPRATTVRNLNSNKIQGMCLPGRDITKDSYLEQNRSIATANEFKGDKVLALGMTPVKSTPTANENYYNSCSIMDSTKNYYRNSTTSASALFSNATIYPKLKLDAGSQSLSTNALNKFNAMFDLKGMSLGIYKKNTLLLTAPSYAENRCLRAPGASCFSDMDCGPSKLISDKIKLLNSEDTDLQSILNKYEIKFWQEELICSQANNKTDALYDPKNNRCCRDVGNVISLPSTDSVNKIDYKKVAGIDYAMDSTSGRYSRAATIYKELNTGTTYQDLVVAIKDECPTFGGAGCKSTSTLTSQYKTLATIAEKTSCSGDWVRSFANSSGNHKWEKSNLQTYSANIFQCYNWYPGNGGFTCAGLEADDPACPIVQTAPTGPKAQEILNYFAKLELLGIPQIAMETQDYYKGTSEKGLSCKSSPGDRAAAYPNNISAPGTNYAPPAQIFAVGAVAEYQDTSKVMLSAGDPTNFQTNSFKQIFKSDEVVSCLPAGTQMKAGDAPARCCTGIINATTLKCQLDDYIDVSVYTNRYVSSEAKKLNSALFDTSGYIKDPGQAAVLACEKQMCGSGYVAFGVLISSMKIPGQLDSNTKVFRFLENSTAADNEKGLLDLYNKGLKLNNHAYCIPKALADSVSANNASEITVIACGN